MARCVRVYLNGERRFFATVRTEDTREWLEYNQTYRPGNALFVNGVCYGNGYFSEERVKEIEKELTDEEIRNIKPVLTAEQMARNLEAEIWLAEYIRQRNREKWDRRFSELEQDYRK